MSFKHLKGCRGANLKRLTVAKFRFDYSKGLACSVFKDLLGIVKIGIVQSPERQEDAKVHLVT